MFLFKESCIFFLAQLVNAIRSKTKIGEVTKNRVQKIGLIQS